MRLLRVNERTALRRKERGAVPLQRLDTDPGAESVTDELGRIEFGELY